MADTPGFGSVADDGTVAYLDFSTDVVSFTTQDNIYLYSPATQTNQLISLTSNSGGIFDSGPAGGCEGAVISSDGSTVAYVSSAPDIVDFQQGGFVDNVFRYNRSTGTTTLVSGAGGSPQRRRATPAPAVTATTWPSARTGRVLVFASMATNLVSGQRGGRRQRLPVRRPAPRSAAPSAA